MRQHMRRRLVFAAVFCIGLGSYFAFSGTNREVAPWLLIGGIVYAVVSLILERRER